MTINTGILSSLCIPHLIQRLPTMACCSVAEMGLSSTNVLASLAENTKIVGSMWILSSALFTTYSTTTFLKYQDERGILSSGSKSVLAPSMARPALLTLYRFAGSLFLGLVAHPNLHVLQRFQETTAACRPFAIPATFLFVANYANSISLDRIGISLTYTSKCGIPLITVLLTLLMDGTKALPNAGALLSLIPIALGIAAASWNSPNFEAWGFMAAMISCVAQSGLNVSSKRAMMKTGLTGAHAQRAMVAVGFVIVMAMSFIQNASSSSSDVEVSKSLPPPNWLSAMAILAYHVEYVLSFMFVKLVAPITYGACDAIRRLAIIITGQWMFGGKPFSSLNYVGMGLALLGALGYSISSSL